MAEDSKENLLSAVEQPGKAKSTTLAKKPAKKKEAKEPEPVYYTYEDFPYEDLLVYAGLDCVVSSEILAQIYPRLVKEPDYIYYEDGVKRVGKAPSIMESIDRYRRKAFEFTIDMELNGFKYDVERCYELRREMQSELAELREAIYAELPERVDIDSPAALRRYLYDELEFEVINRTKTGDPSTDGDTLKKLAEQYERDWLKTLGKYNDIRSVYTSFVATYVEDFVKSDGRVHPNYNLTGTASFRISGSSPNLTNLPNPKYGVNVRELFTVDEGNVFITFDFSSAEVKILAALCRDPGLLKAIDEGLDFHCYTASNIMGVDYDEFFHIAKVDEDHPKHKEYKRKRQEAKAVTFDEQRLPVAMRVENLVNSVEPVVA